MPPARPSRQYVRPTKPLSAQAIAALMILSASPRALTQEELERSLIRCGAGVSIAEACDQLEGYRFITREQPPPKTARFVITDEGEGAIDRDKVRALRELRQTIDRLKKPHPRDGSILPEETITAHEKLLEAIEAGRFLIPRTRQEIEEMDVVQVERPSREAKTDEDVVEVTRPASRALETAKRQRDQDRPKPRAEEAEGEEEDDSELEQELAAEEAPPRRGRTAPAPQAPAAPQKRRDRGKPARAGSVKPAAGRRRTAAA